MTAISDCVIEQSDFVEDVRFSFSSVYVFCNVQVETKLEEPLSGQYVLENPISVLEVQQSDTRFNMNAICSNMSSVIYFFSHTVDMLKSGCTNNTTDH